jgi:dienelactone hydrolase
MNRSVEETSIHEFEESLGGVTMKRLLFAVVLTLGLVSVASAGITGKEVEYTVNGTTMKGYLAFDPALEGKRPGVLVVHEWWGHNDYARKRADMLAKLGYVALAVDMYGDGKTADHPKDAGAFAGEVRKNMDVGEKRFRAAMELLTAQPNVDAARVAAIGYCFGGAVVLDMARRGVDLKGVVSFHGSLGTSTPAQAGQVTSKVLVMNGADDPLVKPEEIAGFKSEMDAAKVDYTFINYPGAKHSFTNPAADENAKKFNLAALGYSAEADAQSWAEMKSFLAKVLK